MFQGHYREFQGRGCVPVVFKRFQGCSMRFRQRSVFQRCLREFQGYCCGFQKRVSRGFRDVSGCSRTSPQVSTMHYSSDTDSILTE